MPWQSVAPTSALVSSLDESGAGCRQERLEIFDAVGSVYSMTLPCAFVRVGDVIAAVEIIVDVNLPVAIERVDAAIEVVEFFW